MDDSLNREVPAEQGAAGSEGVAVGSDDTLDIHADDEQIYYSEDELEYELEQEDSAYDNSACVAPTNLNSDDRQVHHYHHYHCPDAPCGTARPAAQSHSGVQPVTVEELQGALQQAQIEIRFQRNEQVRLKHALQELSTSFEESLRQVDHTFDQIDHAVAHLRRQRRVRSPSHERPRGRGTSHRRSSPGWEPIDILSPVRRRGPSRNHSSPPRPRPSALSPRRRRSSPQTRSPRATSPHSRSPPSAQPACPDASVQRSATTPAPELPTISLASLDPVRPSESPSRFRARLLTEFPQFSAAIRRNTRRFFFFELLRVREQFPAVSVDVGWSRMVARLGASGFYTSEADVSRAWMIAFGEPPLAHFRRMFEVDVETLRSHLPDSWRNGRGNLIRF